MGRENAKNAEIYKTEMNFKLRKRKTFGFNYTCIIILHYAYIRIHIGGITGWQGGKPYSKIY